MTTKGPNLRLEAEHDSAVELGLEDGLPSFAWVQRGGQVLMTFGPTHGPVRCRSTGCVFTILFIGRC